MQQCYLYNMSTAHKHDLPRRSTSSRRQSSNRNGVSLANPFVHVPGGLAEVGASGTNNRNGIPFDPSWIVSPMDAFKLEDHQDAIQKLPTSLGVPDYVQVYEYDSTTTSSPRNHPIKHNVVVDGLVDTITDIAAWPPPKKQKILQDETHSLQELGHMARQVLDVQLARSGAVLFRNLQHRIKTTEDFSIFWKACYEHKHHASKAWTPARYMPNGRNRETKGGVDLATNIGCQYLLPCHHEMAYNPRPNRRIAFYCMEHAKVGGETLVARSSVMTRHIRSELQDHVRTHGGVHNLRSYVDRDNMDDSSGTDRPGIDNKKYAMFKPITWQEKCETEDRKEAIQFFRKLGFEDIEFDEKGTLHVNYLASGFIPNVGHTNKEKKNGNKEQKDVWFNILHTNMPMITLGDGSRLSTKQLVGLRADQWNAVKSFKLRKGDWLVLDNLAVSHGRLPYEEDPENPRTLLTVYTE